VEVPTDLRMPFAQCHLTPSIGIGHLFMRERKAPEYSVQCRRGPHGRRLLLGRREQIV